MYISLQLRDKRHTNPIKTQADMGFHTGEDYKQHNHYSSLFQAGLVFSHVVHIFLFIPISKLQQSNELQKR